MQALTAYLNQQMVQQLAEVVFVEGLDYAERRQMVMNGAADTRLGSAVLIMF